MERAFIVRGGGVRLRSWHYRFNFILIGCWVTVFVLLEVTHALLHGSLYLLANPCNRQVASTLSARTASVPLVGSGGLSSRSCLSMCSSTVSSTRTTPRSYSHPPSVYLLAMFVVPLFKNQFLNRKLRTLAIKSMWTSVGSVIATMVNLVMLIMIEAPGWLCLGSCAIDVFANAVLLFYVGFHPSTPSFAAAHNFTRR